MDRRIGGLALLAIAGLTLLVVPNLSGRPIGGSPTSQYVPPPPQVGQCVTQLSGVPQNDGSQDDPLIAYPVAAYGPCSAAVVGEVMSVQPESPALPAVPLSSYTAASSACELDEVNYVGSIGPFDLSNPNVPSVAWQAAVTIQSVAVGPSPLQLRAGQTWAACVGTTSDGVRYTGRLAGALTRGTLPSTFGTCWGSLPPAGQMDFPVTSCGQPHQVEILGTTQVTDPKTTVAEVNKTCLGFARRAMRTEDPTRGGTVTIGLYTSDGPVVRVDATNLTNQFLGCTASVAGPQRLVGTLIGLGDRPVPTTG